MERVWKRDVVGVNEQRAQCRNAGCVTAREIATVDHEKNTSTLIVQISQCGCNLIETPVAMQNSG